MNLRKRIEAVEQSMKNVGEQRTVFAWLTRDFTRPKKQMGHFKYPAQFTESPDSSFA